MMRAVVDSDCYNFWLRDIAGHHVVMTTNTHDFNQDSFDGTSIIENNLIPAAS